MAGVDIMFVLTMMFRHPLNLEEPVKEDSPLYAHVREVMKARIDFPFRARLKVRDQLHVRLHGLETQVMKYIPSVKLNKKCVQGYQMMHKRVGMSDEMTKQP